MIKCPHCNKEIVNITEFNADNMLLEVEIKKKGRHVFRGADGDPYCIDGDNVYRYNISDENELHEWKHVSTKWNAVRNMQGNIYIVWEENIKPYYNVSNPFKNI